MLIVREEARKHIPEGAQNPQVMFTALHTSSVKKAGCVLSLLFVYVKFII